MARKLEIQVVGDTRDLERALGRAGKQTSGFGSKLGGLAKAGALAGGAAGLGAVFFTLKSGISEWQESTKVAAQTNAVIKSTGGIANVTAKHVDSLAGSILKKSGIDDEATKSAENMILTFKRIRNEAGAGNKIFDQTTQAVADMDTAMTHGNSTSESMSKTAIRIGKALNDPIKGITALSKVGVTFDEGTKKQIKSLVEHGHTLQAQKIILKELNSEFGGSAAAMGKTLPGQIKILRESFNNWAGDLVTKMIPTLTNMGNWIRTNWPQISATIRNAWNQQIRPALAAMIAIVAAVAAAIRQHWGTIGPIVKSVGNQIKAVVAVITAVLRGVAALLRGDWSEAWKQLQNVVRGVFNALRAQITTSALILRAAMSALARGLLAALQAGLSGLGAVAMKALNGIHHAIRQVAGAAFGWAQEIASRIIAGIVSGLSGLAGRVAGAVKSGISAGIHKAGGILHGSGEFQFTAHAVGKPLMDGIAAGIRANEMAVVNALKGVLTRAVASKNFGVVSSIIQQMLSAKQGAVRTPAEKAIASIERARNLDDLKQSIADAKTAVTNSAAALTAAQAEGDPATIAAAQAQLAADQRAQARAAQDLVLFNLQEKAAKQRAALDAKQMVQQIKLGMTLDRLNVLFDKQHVTVGALLAAVRRILRNLRVPGFAGGVRNFSGGLAMVGERGPELVSLPRGSSVTPNGGLAGGGINIYLTNHGVLGSEREVKSWLRNAAEEFRQQNGRPMFGAA